VGRHSGSDTNTSTTMLDCGERGGNDVCLSQTFNVDHQTRPWPAFQHRVTRS